MQYVFLALMCGFAGAYAIVKQHGSFVSKLILKAIASMCFVLIAFAGRIGAEQPYFSLIMIALCLSLVGDVMLIINDDRTKAAGGIAFLLAHCAYIVSFFLYAAPGWYDAVLFTALALIGILIFAKIRKQAGRYVPLAVLYGIVLCVMVTKAVSMLFVVGIEPLFASFAALGGVLFAFSDVILARARLKPDEMGMASIMSVIVYYAAQGLLALSVAI